MKEKIKGLGLRAKAAIVAVAAPVGLLGMRLAARAADGDVTDTPGTLNYRAGDSFLWTIFNLIKGFIFDNPALAALIGLAILISLVFWAVRRRGRV